MALLRVLVPLSEGAVQKHPEWPEPACKVQHQDGERETEGPVERCGHPTSHIRPQKMTLETGFQTWFFVLRCSFFPVFSKFSSRFVGLGFFCRCCFCGVLFVLCVFCVLFTPTMFLKNTPLFFSNSNCLLAFGKTQEREEGAVSDIVMVSGHFWSHGVHIKGGMGKEGEKRWFKSNCWKLQLPSYFIHWDLFLILWAPNIFCSSSSWKKLPVRVLRDKKQYPHQISDLWERHRSSVDEHIEMTCVWAIGLSEWQGKILSIIWVWFNFSLNYHRHCRDKKQETGWELRA